MKKIYLLLLTVFAFGSFSFAQVTGNKFIPGDYATLVSAITDLNTNGVGTGGATINIAAGFTETAPAGGYLLGSTTLNGSLSAVNTLTIQKDPATSGANPLLTAPVGTLTTVDAIFILAGVDYTTIDGIDLRESAANTTATQAMERGYFLVNLNGTAPFDGCQNNTIKNCTITLNRTIATASVGIYFNHSTSNGTAVTITVPGDAHSNNKIYSNRITNCIRGIYLIGYNAASPYTLYDQGNDIGGTSASTGNIITNFGTQYATVAGILAQYQNALNVSYNTINNLADGGAVTNGTMYGIDVYGLNATFTTNNNNITVSHTPSSTAYYIYALACDGGTSFTANNNVISSTLVSGSSNASIQNAAIINSATNFNASGNTLSVTHGNNGPPVSIFNSGNGSLNITNNTNNFTNTSATTQAYLGIYSSTALTGSLTIQSNTFNASSAATASGNYYCVYSGATVAGTETISDNKFANIAYATTANMILIYAVNATNNVAVANNTVTGSVSKTAAGNAFYGYLNTGAPTGGTANIYGNNFANITLTGATGFYGINHAVTGTTQTVNIYNNTIGAATLGTSASFGINFNGAASGSVYNNTVRSLSGTGAVTLTGIAANLGLSNGVYRNKIYDLQENNASGVVYGIAVAGGTNASTNNIHNNLIGDLRAPITSSANDAVRGISITSTATTSNIYVYYNSVYLNAVSSGANFTTSGIYHTISTTATTGALNLRNNIIVNNSTPNGTGLAIAFRRSAGAANNLANYASTSNNNLFYAGTPSATHLIYSDGTSTAQTLATYQAGVFTAGTIAPRDAVSVTEDPPFLSINGSSANFLHINPSVLTLAESGASNIASFTTDFDGDIRQGNPGYPGTGTAPDIGADEFDATIDITAPDITYTTIATSCSTGDRALSAVITDASGVPASGALVPRVYYRKGLLGTWYSQAGTLFSGTSYSGTWNFSIVASDMGGLTGGDIVYYYVIAQDVAAIPNIGSTPSGVVATDVNTVAVHPLLPAAFNVGLTLSGNYTVGAAGAYPTLTAAVASYNASCLGGPVTFTLIDGTYPSETFPITINANTDASSTNTLTIKPATTATITGSHANAIIKLNGADYVIIDGSNSGGTDRSLSISNSNTGTSSAVVWLSSPAAGNGATNNTVRNCNISGSATSATYGGIVSSGATVISLALVANSNNTIQNNSIATAQEGIVVYGYATISDNNWLITQNAITNLGFNAMYLNNMQNYTLSSNVISNVILAGNPYVAAIELALAHSNGTITRNSISGIKNLSTSAYGAHGIYLGATSTASNVTISNNFIYDVTANGNATLAGNGFGIYAASGGGYNIYHNTVTLNTNQTTATGTTAAMMINGVTTAGSLNIRNNIFANLQTTGAPAATRYAIYSANANTIFSAIDYNDYYTSGTNLGFLGSNRVTLGDIQTGFGSNLASVNVLPNFVSVTNLHLTTNNCSLDDKGTPIAGITQDIDADTRSVTVPDIGADEFTAYNAGVLSGVAATAVCATKAVVNTGTIFVDGGCNLIAKVLPSGGGTAVTGTINACVTLDATPLFFNGEPYVQRHYDIEPATTPGTATATVTLYFTDQEFITYNTNNSGAWPLLPTSVLGNADPARGNVRITQFHGTPTGGLPTTTPGNYTGTRVLINPGAANVVWNGNYWEVTIPITGFSGFYLHSTQFGTPLPIIVNYLNGRKQGSNHALDWKVTCTSTPRAIMTLERSSDARNYTGIHTITADAARCNSPFDYVDANPLKGMNYYRLKIVDADGKLTYSTTVALLNAVKGFDIISIAPNPVVADKCKLNLASAQAGKMEVVIVDMQGRLVSRQSLTLIAGFNSLPVNVSNLTAGTYSMYGTSGEDRSRTVRFVKQ